MQPEEVMMQAYAKPKKEGNRFGLVIAMGIMLFLAAIAGIIFGVYEMMMRNSEVEEAKAECAKQIEEAKGTGCMDTKEVATITNEVAQNLIDPYLTPLTYLKNIFNYDFDENMKALIAYKNLGIEDAMGSKNDKTRVSYDSLNGEYKKLFAGTNSLGRTDFRVSNLENIKYYDGEGGAADYFEVDVGGSGGAGLAMFDILKSAGYDEDGNVTIEIYHDVVSLCDAKKAAPKDDEEEEEKADYCVDATGNSVITRSIDDYNLKDLINKYEKDIPKFKLKFVKQSNRLVLSDISKI